MPEPVEIIQAYGQTLKHYDTSGSYGVQWTCDCEEYMGGKTANSRYWPERVRKAVDEYKAARNRSLASAANECLKTRRRVTTVNAAADQS